MLELTPGTLKGADGRGTSLTSNGLCAGRKSSLDLASSNKKRHLLLAD
jgi:hypothetical protein